MEKESMTKRLDRVFPGAILLVIVAAVIFFAAGWLMNEARGGEEMKAILDDLRLFAADLGAHGTALKIGSYLVAWTDPNIDVFLTLFRDLVEEIRVELEEE